MTNVKFRDMFDRNGNKFPQMYIILNDEHVGYVETINWGVALIKRLSNDQVEMIKKGIAEQLDGSAKNVAIPPQPVELEEEDDEEFA